MYLNHESSDGTPGSLTQWETRFQARLRRQQAHEINQVLGLARVTGVPFSTSFYPPESRILEAALETASNDATTVFQQSKSEPAAGSSTRLQITPTHTPAYVDPALPTLTQFPVTESTVIRTDQCSITSVRVPLVLIEGSSRTEKMDEIRAIASSTTPALSVTLPGFFITGSPSQILQNRGSLPSSLQKEAAPSASKQPVAMPINIITSPIPARGRSPRVEISTPKKRLAESTPNTSKRKTGPATESPVNQKKRKTESEDTPASIQADKTIPIPTTVKTTKAFSVSNITPAPPTARTTPDTARMGYDASRLDDLRRLAKQRNVEYLGLKKAQIVANLEADDEAKVGYEATKLDDLRRLAKQRGVQYLGLKKAQVVANLKADDKGRRS